MMDIWVILWIIICITILISVLESISRRAKERRRQLEDQEMQQRLNLQPFHVYTLQPYGSPRSSSATPPFSSAILSMQQQQQLHRMQELKAGQDLPPKYEDVVLTVPGFVATTENNNSHATNTTQNLRVERY